MAKGTVKRLAEQGSSVFLREWKTRSSALLAVRFSVLKFVLTTWRLVDACDLTLRDMYTFVLASAAWPLGCGLTSSTIGRCNLLPRYERQALHATGHVQQGVQT